MAKSNKFGTFGGVFTPSILTILGVIMYLRLPMIVGEAGLLYTIGIIVIAHIISATTGLSVSSIATDKKVKAGGTYYMISRSLGLPIGGTLGLALFVGLSFSVSLYLIGFSESFLNYWGFENSINSIRIAGTAMLILVTTITFISTSLAIKSQYFIMTAIVLSLLSMFFGKHDFSPEVPLISNPSSTVPLMVLFGIFFPAVTGFEAGVSMSGDLKDPKKSIPLGSISAIVVGLVVYLGLAFYFSYTVDGEQLRSNPNVLLEISLYAPLVIAGIWGATISSALGSILGAPRILQATAADKITPKLFAKGVGATNEPRNALILTFFIAECGILIGELDVIARIVSIFFITTYGFLNLSCAFEAWTSADFRPSFKTPVWVSLLGAVACFLVMIQLDFVATLGATIILGLLFLYLKRKELSLQSGDAWSGVWASLVKAGLERLNRENLQTRNWRPNIIMFVGEEKERPYMAEFGVSIAGKLGMLSAFELVESDKPLLLKPENEMSGSNREVNYFFHKHYCRDIYSGMDEIARVYGFAGIEPNTILMGWSKRKDQTQFLKLIESFERSGYNSVFLSYNHQRKFGNSKTIDIWWSGWGRNLSFAINLMNYITSSNLWKEAEVRLLVINHDNTKAGIIYKTLERIVENFRVRLEIDIINNGIDQSPFDEIIRNESQTTDLTIIGIPGSQNENLDETYGKITNLVAQLGTTLIVTGSEGFEEYSLNLNATIRKEEISREIPELPELTISKYPEIAAETSVVDQLGNKTLEEFNHSTFDEYFEINARINEEIEALAQVLKTSLLKISVDQDSFRASRALAKIRSDFYYKSKKMLNDLIDGKLDAQREILRLGIESYVETLQKEIQQFPRALKIKHPKEELKIKKGDSSAVKWLKMKKKLSHPFSKAYIPVTVNYRKIAQYYLRDTRYQFLSSYLMQFEASSFNYLNQLRMAIAFMDDQLGRIEKKIEEESLTLNDLNEAGELIDNKVESLHGLQNRTRLQYRTRLLVEFRQNVQLFNNDLEKLNINKIIKRKTRSRRYYEQLRENSLAFAQLWYEKAVLIANKNYLDASVLSFRDRVHHETEEFIAETVTETETRFLNTLDDIKKQLEEFRKNKQKPKGFKWPKVPSNDNELQKDFDERGKKLSGLAQALPEKITIAIGSSLISDRRNDDEEEIYEIFLNRIALHFLESQYLGPVMEHLEKSSETIKSLIFHINDMLSLARFSLENVNREVEEAHKVMNQTIEDTVKNIQKEKERVRELKSGIVSIADNLLDEMFDSLSSYKIHESASEFSQLLRGYQSKKVLTRFGASGKKIGDFFKDNVVKLLYSRSEGILLAQRLAEHNRVKTIGEKTLDIVDQISPEQTLMDRLPHYYKNLFSGRSSIGESFWIKRPVEWERLKTAINRYKSGYHGAILILGERNTGKTAFCTHLSMKKFTPEKIYQLFPPQAGSSSAEDFVKELSKVTSLNGPLEEIMNALPHQSAVVIHDLELWWERSSSGYEVIRTLSWLINEYSSKCLFIINTNPFAYELINKVHPLEKLFISAIKCQPFRSEELRDLVMSRHRSSGLQFNLGKRSEKQVSEIKLARLFNSYFDFSEGNPGVTLNAWLANIIEVTAGKIELRYPEMPNMGTLDQLPDDWNIILVQLIIHKRLSYDRLRRILGMNESELTDTISGLSRSGLVKERSSGIYYVNTYIEPFLVKSFKQKEWL